MAIGTKVKVGWDASAVKTGLGKLTAGFSKLGGILGRMGRQVGVGGLRQLGQSVTGLVIQLGTALPREISRLADWSAELRLVAGDTKTATAEVLAMQKAMELSGMSTDMAADTFREFATKMGEAVKDVESEPMRALNDLGIFRPQIVGQSVADQMAMFADAVKNFNGSQQDLAFIMDRFLGGDLGLRAISFFQNYNDLMRDGLVKTKAFAQQVEASKDELQNIVRVRSAFRQKFSELALLVLGGGRGQTGSLVEMIENLDVSGLGEKLGEQFQLFIERWKNEGFQAAINPVLEYLRTAMNDLGRKFGEGIKESLKPGANGSIMDFLVPGSGLLPGAFGKDKSGDETAKNTRRTNEILENINRRESVAVFA